jgi:predicted DNA binding CopG/RHH family protein
MHRKERRIYEKAEADTYLQNWSAGAKVWETHDSAYVDLSKPERVHFPNLKPSTTTISIRLPLGLLERIKIAANKCDVPYQSLIKMWLRRS